MDKVQTKKLYIHNDVIEKIDTRLKKKLSRFYNSYLTS